MSERNGNEPPPERAMEAAAAWHMRIRDGFSQSDFRAWRAWLAERPEHAEAFDRISAFWHDSAALDDLPWPSPEALAGDRYDGSAPLPAAVPADRARRPAARVANRWRFAAAAAVVATLTLVIVASRPPAVDALAYETAAAEHRAVALPDGSDITLGADSRISVGYTDALRAIELTRGEAYFSVAEDAARPFVVRAGARTVRAIGTAFNVNIGIRDIRVTVLEGQVRIEGPAPPAAGVHAAAPPKRIVTEVGSGQEIDYNNREPPGSPQNVDARLATAWRAGRLAFVDVPLESVIADVDRYTEKELIIGDDGVRHLMYTGTVFHREIDDWLRGLEKAFPVRVVAVEDRGILVIASEP